MSEQVFNKLAPFIQEFIYNNKWEELRDIQVKACKVIFETDNHMIISSGTASGKTEAALFPVLSKIYNEDIKSISVLYIGPLKALINDQFERINSLIENADIPICHWHGDTSSGIKKRLRENPRGILQITPESFEGLFIRQPQDIKNMFSDLRYIIIDEVHTFMGSDRGSQLICQLYKLNQIIGKEPRRIGLSATLSNIEAAAYWMKGETGTKVAVIKSSKSRHMALVVEYFNVSELEEKHEFINYLYKTTFNIKTIIFTNSRNMAEETIMKLRNYAKKQKTRDVYHIHHGSLSMALRHETEDKLKSNIDHIVAAATVTLELGIDIGDLDKTIQIGSPSSCSSFVQRLGRSGRRSGCSKMQFIVKEEWNPEGGFICTLNLELLQIIAIIELYVKEKWIESAKKKKYPFSLLYQQTLTVLAVYSELKPKDLARKVLTMPPFREIEHKDYQSLLLHMISLEHIQRTDEGGLIVGIQGEWMINDYKFYAVFPEEDEYKVFYMNKEIGKINKLPSKNACFTLSGSSWKVIETKPEKKMIFVEPVTGTKETLFVSSPVEVDDVIVTKMRDILFSKEGYSYLSPKAIYRLESMRVSGSYLRHPNNNEINLFKDTCTPISNNALYFMPWLGTRKMKTLDKILSLEWVIEELKIHKISKVNTLCYYIVTKLKSSAFETKLNQCIQLMEDPCELIDEDEVIPYSDKYDELMPRQLLVKSYVYNKLDLMGLKTN